MGIAGVGRIGAQHARMLARHPLVDDLVAVDHDTSRATALATELGASATASFESLLDRDLDAVVIATPTPTHPELVAAALRRELPILCEKPLAATVAAARDLAALVDSAGGRVQIGFHRRFDAGFVAARDAVRSGEVGELRRLHVVGADPFPPSAEFVAASGGIFRDLSIHDIDSVRFVSGREITHVVAVGVNRGPAYMAEAGDVDEAVAILILDDGTLATVQASRSNGQGYDFRLEAAGTLGTRVTGLNRYSPFTSVDADADGATGQPWPGGGHRFIPAFEAEIDWFVHFARGERDNRCTVHDALAATVVCDALARSAAGQRMVQVVDASAS